MEILFFLVLPDKKKQHMRYLLLLFVLLTTFIVLAVNSSKLAMADNIANAAKDTGTATGNGQEALQNTLAHTRAALAYAAQHHYDTSFCLLADMRLPSGRNRLFMYNFSQHAITASALVAHGSCNKAFLSEAKFSNAPGCGCTAYGKYKIGNKYNGRFGTAYKLYGLDSSNGHAFERNIVLHSYDGVPDKETYPAPIGNSLGCIMVSATTLKMLAKKIDKSSRPVLLWVF